LQAITFRNISSAVKKRFPTMDHLVTSGIITGNELKELDAIQSEHVKVCLSDIDSETFF
jgi:hypothetical protein